MSIGPDDITGDPGSEGAGDAVDTAAEHAEGADGGEGAGGDEGYTDRERAIRAEAERDAMQRLIDRYGLAGGEGDPPTQPGPQAAAEELRHDLDEIEDEIAAVRAMANKGDKSAKLQLRMMEMRRKDIGNFVRALQIQQEQIVEMGVPDERRDAFKQFLSEHGDAFKNKAAARKVFLSQQASASKGPAEPTTTPARRETRRPAVDVTPRPVPSREAKAREMTDQQWADAMASLPTAERIELQRKADAGEIVFKD